MIHISSMNNRPEELEMQEGDLVEHPSKNNGFLWGKNTHTNKSGYYPAYKTVEVLKKADVLSFEHIDRKK